jgi:cell division initiation protein
MAAARLDHPILMSAEQVRRREFVTTRRGYDPDQVRLYLVELADQIDVMASMIREARMEAQAASARVGVPAPQPDPYERLASRVASVIKEADTTAERLRLEGGREAERILGEAREDAERIRTEAETRAAEARAEAQRAADEAQDLADRTVSGLASRRQVLVDQLAEMQQRLLGVARDLEAAIDLPADEDIAFVVEDADAFGAEVPTPPNGKIVDVRTGEERPPPRPDPVRVIADEVLDDPSYEDLWDGTEAIRLEVPDIPPLDLSWGPEDEDGPTGSA